ncbi:hypothetical protein [Leisingera sp. ANG-M7]|uniref:hypothetical protein n=1 Tax=Leisingera sp. ANG-M7 TaxID=1577902 RepID=UPI00057FCF7E|nr:hypothetical protein [Leisingera sp. ANG-M7]KIC36521.1 hypothetical protein RA26_12345 [Leisingera sp. ANG-M7]
MSHFELSMLRLMRAMKVTTDCARYYLAGALVEPIEGGGAWIVATNGTVMLIQKDESAKAPRPAIIRVTPAEFEPEEDEFGNVSTTWNWGTSTIKIPTGDIYSTHAAPVSWKENEPFTHAIAEFVEKADRFPEWRSAISAKRKDPRLAVPDERYTAVQPGQLQHLTEWAIGFEIHPAEPAHAQTITYVGDPNSLGVIMPMARDRDNHLPAIMTAIQANQS